MRRNHIIGVTLCLVFVFAIYFFGYRDSHQYSKKAGPASTISQDARKDNVTDKTAAQSVSRPSTAIGKGLRDQTPQALARTVLRYKNRSPENQGPLHDALNRLCSEGSQGSEEAIDELIRLSREFDDDRILHQILQALGRTEGQEANEALSDALRRKMEYPVEAIRIVSYFPTGPSGVLEPSLVDDLLLVAEDPAINPASRSAILDAVKHKGGSYGRKETHGLR